jgi:hypothetical protein
LSSSDRPAFAIFHSAILNSSSALYQSLPVVRIGKPAASARMHRGCSLFM